MRIGHIDLSAPITVAEEQLVLLVEALTAHRIEQHVLVRNPFLARRLSACDAVTVGPLVRSPLAASFLMPAVDLVHAHESKGANSGMLLNLACSVPYVLTHREPRGPGMNPLRRLNFARAAAIMCANDRLGAERMAAEHLRVYRRALQSHGVPAMRV